MSINIRCTKCQKTYKLGKRTCNCGNNLIINRVFRVRYKMPDGRWQSKQAPTLDLAKAIESEYRVDAIKESVWDIHKAPNIDQVWSKYEKWGETNKRSFRTDKGLWNNHLKGRFAGKRMDKILPRDVQKMLDELALTKSSGNATKGQLLSPATVRHCLVLLSRLYTWSTKQALYKGLNPCREVSAPSFDNRMTDALSIEDVKRLLGALEKESNERATSVIRFGLATGRRRDEILTLTFNNVDFDNGLVTFKGQHCKNGKTQTIPVNQAAMNVLKRCRELRISDYVFPCQTGKYYHSFSRTWRRIRDKAEVNVRFHGLRHSFASFLASSGQVDLHMIKELLGHKDLSMTQRYSHLVDSALRRAASVANRLLK